MLPQVATFNQGVWQDTEQLTTCVRESRPITVYGGVIYDDESNDIFLDSHGVKTPDWWWKVLLTTNDRGQDEVISWIFPNQEGLRNVDSFLVSVRDIEARLNDGLGPIPVPSFLKSARPGTRWTQPC
jgi:endonuclease G